MMMEIQKKKRFYHYFLDLVKAHPFVCFVLLLLLLRQGMTLCFYMLANSGAQVDDQLMVKLADSLLNRQWLGAYDQNTLVKGIGFPLYLAICKFLGISYLQGTTILYESSCVLFVYVVKDIFKRPFWKYFLFAVLLFNPASFALQTFQRVYRNSITSAQVLILLACFFALYLYRKKSYVKLLIFSLIGGLDLAWFWNTREDNIWILPFVLVVYVILFIFSITQYHRVKLKGLLLYLLIFTFPFLILWGVNTGICLLNRHYYGIYTTNELNDSAFTDAMKALYAVKPEEDIPYVSITREKIKQLTQYSPALKSIASALDKTMDMYGMSPASKNSFLEYWQREDWGPLADGEVADGMFFWALRDAGYESGYYKDAQTANAFFAQMAAEINQAMDEGKVVRQAAMPSALMAPWRKGFAGKLCNAFFKCVSFASSYQNVSAENEPSVTEPKENYQLFEKITGNKGITDVYAQASGKLNLPQQKRYLLQIKDQRERVLAEIGNQYAAEDGLHFSTDYFPIYIYDFEINHYHMDIYDETNLQLVQQIPLNEGESFTNQYKIHFILNKTLSKKAAFSVKVSHVITRLYHYTGVLCLFIGLISYAAISILWLTNKQFRKRLYTPWLFLTAILGCFIVLCLGISYNEITACPSINSLYLSASYGLLLAFWAMAIGVFTEFLFPGRRKKDKISSKH